MGLTLNASNGVRPLTEAEKAAVRKDLDVVGYVNGSLVSADGNPLYADIAYAAVASTTGTPGQVRRLSDGPDRGALLVWSIPEGRSTYAWCWQIYPLAAYL